MTGNLVIVFFNEPFGGVLPGTQGAVLATLLRTGTPLTGRQVHGLLRDNFSLWSVQEALKRLKKLGLVSTEQIGRAGVHSINEEHYTVKHLRKLLSPITALKEVVHDVVGDDVSAVIVFGSIARGTARPTSDIDLAVIARSGWDKRARLEDAVRTRLGNDCDVLTITSTEFSRLAVEGEPIVATILADGVPLIGSMPRDKHGAA
jgi:predicted nucleotidyltransferase